MTIGPDPIISTLRMPGSLGISYLSQEAVKEAVGVRRAWRSLRVPLYAPDGLRHVSQTFYGAIVQIGVSDSIVGRQRVCVHHIAVILRSEVETARIALKDR